MRSRIVAAALFAALIAVAALGTWWLTGLRQEEDPPHEKVYGERISTYIRSMLKDCDANKDGRLDYDEFTSGYDTHKLDKSDREVFDAAEAFARLDVDRDGFIGEKEIKFFDTVRNLQDWNKFNEEQNAKGLVVKRFGSTTLFLNPVQLKFFNAEVSDANQGNLVFGGVGFARKYFGLWESERKPNAPEIWKLRKCTWARLTLADGKTLEGFAREGDSSEAAKKDNIPDARVLLLQADGRIQSFKRNDVQAIDYNEDSPQARHLRRIADPHFAFADPNVELEVARNCLKHGMKDDAQRAYQRVLIFQFDNEEALKALGYKLNGVQYAKVE